MDDDYPENWPNQKDKFWSTSRVCLGKFAYYLKDDENCHEEENRLTDSKHMAEANYQFYWIYKNQMNMGQKMGNANFFV